LKYPISIGQAKSNFSSEIPADVAFVIEEEYSANKHHVIPFNHVFKAFVNRCGRNVLLNGFGGAVGTIDDHLDWLRLRPAKVEQNKKRESKCCVFQARII
jgi:hypothetical protein